MLRTLDSEQIDLLLRLIDLTKTICNKYKCSTDVGIEGLLIGLEKYEENKRQKTKIDLYVVWYIKTAIEYHLGRNNKDTRIWKEMLVKDKRFK